MKLLKNLLSVFSLVLLFSACQKEYSIETGSFGGLARGSLQDTLGVCQPIDVKGQFFTDSTLTDSNFVNVQVRITTPGIYRISSDAQNGFSFKDSGYVGTAGWHTFKLKGTGRPVLPGTTDFIVTFDTTICSFSVQVSQGTGAGGGTPAVFTLQPASTGGCSATVQGTYQTGTPLGISHSIALQVNVTTAGTYNITTNAVNGISFIGSGAFNNTGIQTITLRGTGTPTTAGTTTIPVTAGASSCSFSVAVSQGTGGGGTTNPNDADSAWQFTEGTRFYHGPVLDAFDSTISAGYTVNIVGVTSATEDTALIMGVLFSGGAIQPGTYSTNGFAAFSFRDFKNPAIPDGVVVYAADPTVAGVNMQIIISAYNATTKVITGTYAGTARNAAGATVNITGGKFTAVVR